MIEAVTSGSVRRSEGEEAWVWPGTLFVTNEVVVELGVGLGGGLPPLIVIVIVSIGSLLVAHVPDAGVGTGHVCGDGMVFGVGLACEVGFGGTKTPGSTCDQLSVPNDDVFVLVLVLDWELDSSGEILAEDTTDNDEDPAGRLDGSQAPVVADGLGHTLPGDPASLEGVGCDLAVPDEGNDAVACAGC